MGLITQATSKDSGKPAHLRSLGMCRGGGRSLVFVGSGGGARSLSSLSELSLVPYEPCHEKTGLRGFRPRKTQTGLVNQRLARGLKIWI